MSVTFMCSMLRLCLYKLFGVFLCSAAVVCYKWILMYNEYIWPKPRLLSVQAKSTTFRYAPLTEEEKCWLWTLLESLLPPTRLLVKRRGQIQTVKASKKKKSFFFFFFPLSDHNHQADYFVAMVHAGYVCVAIIHRTMTRTTGSLSCAHMFMHAIAHGGVRTPKESLHWNLTLGRKSLAAPGNRTCVSGLTGPMLYQLSYIPSL